MFSFYPIIQQTGKKSIDAKNFLGRVPARRIAGDGGGAKKSSSFYREALGLSAVQLVATCSLDSPFPERSLPFENLIRFCRTMGFSYLYMGVSSAKFEIKGW